MFYELMSAARVGAAPISHLLATVVAHTQAAFGINTNLRDPMFVMHRVLQITLLSNLLLNNLHVAAVHILKCSVI